MKKKSKENDELSTALSPGGLLSEKISRRTFGKLLGAQTLLASAASAVTLSGCGGGGGDDAPAPAVDPGTQTLTRAEFVSTVSTYFGWVHSSEYNDEEKSAQPTYLDVFVGSTPYAKEIEEALEESVISNGEAYFYPEKTITREDAADIYVKAFMIPTTTANALSAFTDTASISASKKASVNAIVNAGFMKGTSATLFSPQGTLTGNDAKAILTAITAGMTVPVQVMAKPGTTSFRRYLHFSTPQQAKSSDPNAATIYVPALPATPGPTDVTIYYTFTKDNTEPPNPTTASTKYDPYNNGLFQCAGDGVHDNITYKFKAMAVRNGVASAVRSFTWFIYRPVTSNFIAKLMRPATSTCPSVWRIVNPNDVNRAHVFYIEGSTRGVVFDAGQYPITKGDLKTFIDTIASKPYDLILGHNHPDHSAQVPNLLAGGIKLFLPEIEFFDLSTSLYAAYFTGTPTARSATNTDLIQYVKDGDEFDLGNAKLTVYQAPGHKHGLCIVQDKVNGLLFTSDMYGCNKPVTADFVDVSLVKSDLQLSFLQQLETNFKKGNSLTTTGTISEVYNAHNEYPTTHESIKNFQKVYQNLVDYGASAPGAHAGWHGSKTFEVNIGDPWHNKQWATCQPGWGKIDVPTINLTKPTAAAGYTTNATIDYTATDGIKKYSVLSNIEFDGGTLVGVTVAWAAAGTGKPANQLPNKFDPWTYAYTVNVPAATNSIVVRPTAMASKFTSMKVNGTTVTQTSSTTVAVSAGSKITVDIVAPDGVTASSYTFTVAKV
jgi:hypothetical protein